MPGGNIINVAAVRARITGSGNVIPTLYGLDEIESSQLAPMILSTTDRNEKTVLALFVTTRVKLKLQTLVIDETMKVNNITIFVKPIWASLPI